MSGSAASVIALASLVTGALVLELTARRSRDRATAGQVLGATMRSTPGRVVVLAAWIWLGVHFLAR